MDVNPKLKQDIDESIETLYAFSKYIDQPGLDKLRKIVEVRTPASILKSIPQDPSGPFDVHREIRLQYNLVQKIREELLNEHGHFREISDSRIIKDTLSAFSGFLTLYLKAEEKIDKDRRLQIIEKTTVEVLKDTSPEVVDKFMAELESRLKGV